MLIPAALKGVVGAFKPGELRRAGKACGLIAFTYDKLSTRVCADMTFSIQSNEFLNR